MPEFPPETHADLVFIGAGPKTTGILLAIAAAPGAGRGLSIHLIDPFPPGAGRIWRTEQSPHLWMNSRTEDITIFPDSSCTLDRSPVHGPTLHEWIHGQGRPRLAEAGLGAEAESLDSQSFASRRIQGHYLEWAFEQAIENLAATVSIHRSRVEALHRFPDRQGSRLVTSGGVSILADVVVSAQGHLEMSPADADLDLERLAATVPAARLGLYYQRPGYTADLDFTGIPAGADVLARGFGLAFIDLMVMVTQGRGGEFLETGDRLRYRSSGTEPVLWVGSSRGVPYTPKLGYSRADVPGAPAVALRYLADNRLDAVATGPFIDFRNIIGPLAELELTFAHYEHLLWKRGIESTSVLDEIDALGGQIIDSATAHSSGDAMDTATSIAGATHPCSQPLSAGRARIAAKASAVLDDPAEIFDLAAIDRPIDDLRFDSLGESEQVVREHITRHLKRSAELLHSADLAVFEALVKSYVAIRLLDRAGRVSSSDRSAFVEGSFHSLFSYIGSGPPPERIRQIIALHDAGLLRFFGPGLQVEATERGFRARSSAHPDSMTFSYFVEARLATQSAARAEDPVLESLGASGAILLEADGDGAARAKLRTDAHSHALDTTGRAQTDLFLLGPAVSGATSEAFSRPRTDAPVFKDNERIASAILDSLSAAEAAGLQLQTA